MDTATAKTLYGKLMKDARRYLNGSRSDLAHDFVADVFVIALTAISNGSVSPWTQYYFLRGVLRYEIKMAYRNAKIGFKYRLEFTKHQVSSVDTALSNARVTPNQEAWLFLRETIKRVDAMSIKTRTCVDLAAIGNTTKEIAFILKCSEASVNSALQYARSLLRNEGYWDDGRTSRSVGIRKNKKRWQVFFWDGNRERYIGSYSSTSEAAAAYDKAKADAMLRQTEAAA